MTPGHGQPQVQPAVPQATATSKHLEALGVPLQTQRLGNIPNDDRIKCQNCPCCLCSYLVCLMMHQESLNGGAHLVACLLTPTCCNNDTP
jgi:hypothetical protein